MAQCQTDASVCRVCRYSGSDIRLKGCGCRVHAVSCLSENAFRPPWFRCCFSFLACRRPLPSLSVLLSVYLCKFRCSTRRLRLEGEKFFSIFGIFTIRTMAHSTRTGIQVSNPSDNLRERNTHPQKCLLFARLSWLASGLKIEMN